MIKYSTIIKIATDFLYSFTIWCALALAFMLTIAFVIATKGNGTFAMYVASVGVPILKLQMLSMTGIAFSV